MVNDNVYTVDLGNTYDTTLATPFVFECYENTEREVNGAYSPLNDAHYFGNVVFNMYMDWLGMPPLTFKLALKVHYGKDQDNAYWDGSAMIFGDGFTTYYPLTDLNVVAHEVSHGFTEQHSDLVYTGQPGGINEAYSDIAGEAAEYYMRGTVDWLAAASITKNTTALRYFEDPTLDGFSISQAADFTPGLDVHYSSGVFNRAYFLLSNSPGWDPQQGFEVFAQANQFHWVPTSDYEDAACGVINAAFDLGHNKVDVIAAFVDVGIVCPTDTTDSDGDGMPEGWELFWGLDPSDPEDAQADFDGDGATNVQEFNTGANPTIPDSDSDSLTDGDEINIHHTSPILVDTDTDRMSDAFEVQYGFDPLDPSDAALDLDGDGSTNLIEFLLGTDPTDPADFHMALEFMHESFESDLPAGWSTSSTSANGGWAVNTTWSTHGARSFAVSNITHAESATLQYEGYFTDGTFSFDYRTSTEYSWDVLNVYLDDNRVLSASGDSAKSFSINLETGRHSIRFVYSKDDSVDDHEDTVWIDNVLFASENSDLDGDGMENLWELKYGLDPQNPEDAALDADEDGATNLQEFEHGSNPTLPNSDGDSLSDGEEINIYGTSPILSDSDEDKMDDAYEVAYGLDPLDPADAALDLDGDGSSNLDEYNNGTDPTDPEDFNLPIGFTYLSFEDDTLPAGWEITSTGTSKWQQSSDWKTAGSQSLKATNLEGNGVTTLRYTANFTDGTLSFDFRSRFSPLDCCRSLRVWVDDNWVYNQFTFGDSTSRFQQAITAGEHTIEIQLYNSSTSTSDNTAWLDLFMFESDNTDVDDDGMPNLWELQHGLNPEDDSDRDQDADNDLLTNFAEYEAHTDPRSNDSDGDAASDYVEVMVYGTLGDNADSDNDLMFDGYEITFGLNPLDPADAALDGDGDGLTNQEEFQLGTEPTDSESSVEPILYFYETFEGLPDPLWSFSNTQFAQPWQSVSSWSNRGNYSLGVEDGSYFSSASAEITALFSAGTLSFNYKMIFNTSAELRFYVDGVLRYTRSDGEQAISVELTPGVHTLRWEAYKGNFNGGKFYLDDVRFITSENDDLDNDGLPNQWEWEYGLDPQNPTDAELDQDGDGATNRQEFEHGANPTLIDSDGDTLSDGDEINLYGSDPTLTDSDDDDMDDAYEANNGLNPSDPKDADLDLDGDGSSNLDEYNHGTDPTDPDDFIMPLAFAYLTFEEDELPAGWEIDNFFASPWQYSNAWASQGQRSLMAATGNVQEAYTALRYSGWFEAGTLSFDYRTRFFGNDCCFYLRVMVDNTEAFSRSSFGDYKGRLSLDLPAGFHTVEIQQYQNVSTNNASASWIDLLMFESGDSDVDGDTMPNLWELQHGLDPENAGDRDQDGDGDLLTNIEEFQAGTDPGRDDSDGDGAGDGDEVQFHHTLANNPDSDIDGMEDGFELQFGLDPLDPSDADMDSDLDGLTNQQEFQLGTDPTDPDSKRNPYLLWSDTFETGPSPLWRFNRSDMTADWQTTTSWSSGGEYSLAIENLAHFSYAGAEFTALFTAGVLTYDYHAVDANSINHMYVYVDGIGVAAHTESGTGIQAINLTAGVHTIRFTAVRANVNPSPRYYLDNFHFVSSESDDLDLDGMPNDWEQTYGLDPEDPNDADLDPDQDGLTNYQEYESNTDPTEANIDLQITMTKLFETNASEVNYRVRVTNVGLVNATNVTVIHSNESGYPMQFAPKAGSTMLCSGNSDRVDCSIAYLAAGTEEIIDIKVPVDNGSEHNFYSAVSADEVDYNQENNEVLSAYAGCLQWLMLGMLSALYWARRRVWNDRRESYQRCD